MMQSHACLDRKKRKNKTSYKIPNNGNLQFPEDIFIEYYTAQEEENVQ